MQRRDIRYHVPAAMFKVGKKNLEMESHRSGDASVAHKVTGIVERGPELSTRTPAPNLWRPAPNVVLTASFQHHDSESDQQGSMLRLRMLFGMGTSGTVALWRARY